MDTEQHPPSTTRLFDQIFARSYRYERRWDEALWRYYELRAVARLLQEQPSLRDGPILDVGCGNGEVFGWLFGPRPDSCGVDSGATYADDVESARGARVYADVRREDAAHTSFESGRFRLVFSNSVLEHIAPVEPVLREVHRVLAPGGRFLFTTPDPHLYSSDAYEWRRMLGRLGLDAIGRAMARRECDVYRHVSVLPAETWRRFLEEAGFARIERRTYFPKAAARIASRFSGMSRQRFGARFAWLLSREARALSAPLTVSEQEWIDRSRDVLRPVLDFAPSTNDDCGQLFIATKPLT